MGVTRLWNREPKNVEVVQDLDKLVSEPIGFILKGKRHVIHPLKTRDFLAVYEAMAKWDDTVKKAKAGGLTDAELVDGYLAVFQSVCASITRNDVLDMTLPQRVALFNLVLKVIGAEAHVMGEKKNLTA